MSEKLVGAICAGIVIIASGICSLGYIFGNSV